MNPSELLLNIATVGRSFTYKPRTPEQWARRAHQAVDSNFSLAPEPLKTKGVESYEGHPEPQDGVHDGPSEFPKAKVTAATLCLCGHARSDHHTRPVSHTVDGEHDYYCIVSHCAVYAYTDGISAPCSCMHFQASATDKLKLTRPIVGDYDRCANPECGHWKISHCTVRRKKLNAFQIDRGELGYRVCLKPDGTAYGCKHFSLEDSARQCNSTSCSATEDGKDYCRCEKFVSPLARTRAKSPGTPKAPRKPRKEKTAFMTGSFFPVSETAEGV
jgi:hypothetical protein